MSHSDREFNKVAKMKSKLNSVSESFCLVRWKHASINLTAGTAKSCCHHDFKKIELNKNTAQFHDAESEQEVRQQMLDGKKPKDCSYCWWVEENGHSSDRQSWSAKSWMEPFFDEVKKNASSAASHPSWVELNFSSVCNLKCVYCSPVFSSRWYKEIKEFGAYPTEEKFNSIDGLPPLQFESNKVDPNLVEKFDKWLYESLPEIRLLKLTGGEPLLSQHTFRMLEEFSSKKFPNLTCGLNSNLSVDYDLWEKFVSLVERIESNGSLNRFYLHPSLDCMGRGSEYIRFGLDLERFKKNVETYLERTSSHLHFICTLNNLALGGWLEFWEFVYEMKQKHHKPGREINLGTEVLEFPGWLNINILPEEMSEYFDEVTQFVSERIDESGQGFNQVELEGIKKAKSSFESQAENPELARKNFVRFVDEVDRRRGVDFKKTFPELLDFYSACKQLMESDSQPTPELNSKPESDNILA